MVTNWVPLNSTVQVRATVGCGEPGFVPNAPVDRKLALGAVQFGDLGESRHDARHFAAQRAVILPTLPVDRLAIPDVLGAL